MIDKNQGSKIHFLDINPKGSKNNNGEPPKGDDLERRVEVLEKGFSRIEDALARIEKNTIRTDERLNSIETHFATKAELKEVQSDLNKNVLDLRTEFKQGISNLEVKTSEDKSSIIKSVITANIGLLALIAAIIACVIPFVK